MSEVKKIATRDSYGNALVELGKEHENLVVLDADLAAATKTGMFKKAFPESVISTVVSQRCNMMGIAAGLATTGKVPFRKLHLQCLQQDVHLSRFSNSVGYPTSECKNRCNSCRYLRR